MRRTLGNGCPEVSQNLSHTSQRQLAVPVAGATARARQRCRRAPRNRQAHRAINLGVSQPRISQACSAAAKELWTHLLLSFTSGSGKATHRQYSTSGATAAILVPNCRRGIPLPQLVWAPHQFDCLLPQVRLPSQRSALRSMADGFPMHFHHVCGCTRMCRGRPLSFIGNHQFQHTTPTKQRIHSNRKRVRLSVMTGVPLAHAKLSPTQPAL